jgi:hypothetical protein
MVSRIGMRPVRTLSQQAQHLAPGDHGQRLDTGGTEFMRNIGVKAVELTPGDFLTI